MDGELSKEMEMQIAIAAAGDTAFAFLANEENGVRADFAMIVFHELRAS